ncbi:MAG TPA: hypothetical protein VJG13_09445, partial [Thermoanaerobaculia bacterium]|nr:hypothetical protein [Thermoanaerobaculia bacterium]
GRDGARPLQAAEEAGPQGAGPGSLPVPWFRGVTLYSVLAGLCPLIPVPFLDDRALAAVKRTMVRDLARQRGVALSPLQVDYLAGTYRVPRGFWEWLGRTAVALTVKLAGKLFRKIVFVFAIKEGVDTASRAFHEGYLLHLLFDPAEPATEAPRDDLAAWHARWALAGAVSEIDPRPVNQAIRRAFRGRRGAMRQGARVLGRSIRSQGAGAAAELPAAEEERLLGGVGDRLAAELWQERGYLAELEARFLRWVAAARP